jgi:AcrR family transcriptional regulator
MPQPSVRNTALPSKPQSARQRLLDAADELFYEHGINVVGIDRVIERAGVAKASLYDCFGSKEELVRSYVQGRDEQRRARILARTASMTEPRDKALAVFDILAELASRPDFRGCAFSRAGAESSPDSKVRGACELARDWMREFYLDIARQTGAADPEELATKLMVLYDGASVAAQFGGGPVAVAAARASAEVLLDDAASKHRKTRTQR